VRLVEDPRTGIQEACDAVGDQPALADALGVSQQAVSKWVLQGFAPRERVARIAELTGVERRRLIDPKVIEALGLDAD